MDIQAILVIKVDVTGFKEKYGIELYIDDIQRHCDKRFENYNVFVIPFEQSKEERFEPIQLELLSINNCDEIELEQLKEKINTIIKNNELSNIFT